MTTQYLVGPGRLYPDITQAVLAIPNPIIGTGIHEIIVDAGDYPFGTFGQITLALSTCDASNYVHLKAAVGSEHNGSFSAGVRCFRNGSGVGIDVIAFCRVTNITVINNGNFTSVTGFQCRNQTILENCMANTTVAFQNDSSGNCKLYKCIGVKDVVNTSTEIGFDFANGGNALYNCGSYGFFRCYSGDSGSKVVNCWAVHRVQTSASDFASFSSSTSGFNASTDTTAPGTGSITSQTEASFGFTSVVGKDFHISRSSVLRFGGTSQSAIFTTDVDNQTIVTRWPIGFDAFNGIVSGTYYVGPAESLLNWTAAANEIAGQSFTGDVTFIQRGNITETASVSWFFGTNQASFNLRLTSDSPNLGNPNSGNKITANLSSAATIFNFSNASSRTSGKILIDNLYFTKTNASGYAFGIAGVGYCIVHDCLFYEPNFGGSAFFSSGFSPDIEMYNCKVWGNNPNAYQTNVNGPGNVCKIENVTVFNTSGNCFNIQAVPPFSANSTRYIRNCIGYNAGGGNAFQIGAMASSNNASRDLSASGSGSITGISTSVFQSIAQASSDFLRLTILGSILDNAGTTASISGNVSGIRGNARPHGGSSYSIGADEASGDIYQPTSSSPWQNKNPDHKKSSQVKPPKLNLQASAASPGFNSKSNQKDAVSESKDYSAKGNKEAKTTQINIGGQDNFQGDVFKFPKGAKEGFISIIPEPGGYLSGTLGSGQKVQFFNESLQMDHQTIELPFVGHSRATKTRVNGYNKSSGGLSYAFRSNDAIPVFMSHFQNRTGSLLSGGTVYYEFSPVKNPPRLAGSSFGTGSYTQGSFNAFTVSVFKAIGGTGYHFKSGVSELLSLSMQAGGEASLTSNFKFSSSALVGTSAMSGLGTYSTLPSFPSQNCDVYFNGLPVKGFTLISRNRLIDNNKVGTSSCYYKFGRYDVTGGVSVDVPKSAMAYIGSMLTSGTFNIYGTLSNGARDRLIFQMPNCRLDDFNFDMSSSTIEIPFKAYESEDGLTPPLKIMLWTQNYSATSFQPN